MNHQEQAVFDWLNGEPTPEAVAAWQAALRADPELLVLLLEEVRFDQLLSRCLAEEKPAAVRSVDSEMPTSASSARRLPGDDSGKAMSPDQQKIWAKIVAQAWADEAYKSRLLAEPATVLQEEGLDPPAGKVVRIVENTDTQAYLVLPALPPESSDAAECELRLAAMFGGYGCLGW